MVLATFACQDCGWSCKLPVEASTQEPGEGGGWQDEMDARIQDTIWNDDFMAHEKASSVGPWVNRATSHRLCH